MLLNLYHIDRETFNTGGGKSAENDIGICKNKMLRNLEEEKAYWLNKEAVSSTYVASTDEEPVIPEYDYSTVASIIAEIDEKQP